MSDATADTMVVTTIYDRKPTSDPSNPDYSLINDPEYNIQYTHNQERRPVLVRKTQEDFERLNAFCFGTDLEEPWEMRYKKIYDTPFNREVVQFIWNSLGTTIHGQDIEWFDTRRIIEGVYSKLGIDQQYFNWARLGDIKDDFNQIREVMEKAFLHIYRNYEEA